MNMNVNVFNAIPKIERASNIYFTYRYTCGFANAFDCVSFYHPLAIDSCFDSRYYIIDYSETAKCFLNCKDIVTINDIKKQFITFSHPATKKVYIENLTLEQIKSIIDTNYELIVKLNTIVQENELLNQINQI